MVTNSWDQLHTADKQRSLQPFTFLDFRVVLAITNKTTCDNCPQPSHSSLVVSMKSIVVMVIKREDI